MTTTKKIITAAYKTLSYLIFRISSTLFASNVPISNTISGRGRNPSIHPPTHTTPYSFSQFVSSFFCPQMFVEKRKTFPFIVIYRKYVCLLVLSTRSVLLELFIKIENVSWSSRLTYYTQLYVYLSYDLLILNSGAFNYLRKVDPDNGYRHGGCVV